MLIALGMTCAFVSWALVGLFRSLAVNNPRLIDQLNERSSHTVPTLRGGGIGIVLTVLIFGMVVRLGPFRESSPSHYSDAELGFVLAGALLIALISWFDDIHSGIAPGLRLVIHVAAAGLALMGLGGWDMIAVPFLGSVSSPIAGTVISLLWIVGLVNAYNFMDGIDGIAGVQAATASGGWLAVGLLAGIPSLSIMSILIGASAVGFLFHNWPPAKVFMGDTGSAFLGFCLSIIPFYASRPFAGTDAGRLPVAGFLMVAPFVMDSTYTFICRLIKGDILYQAHRSHIYQRLVISGLSHLEVTLAYMALGLAASSAGLSYILLEDRAVAALASLSVAVAVLIIPLIWASARENRS